MSDVVLLIAENELLDEFIEHDILQAIGDNPIARISLPKENAAPIMFHRAIPQHSCGIIAVNFISRGFVPEMRCVLNALVSEIICSKARYVLLLTGCRDELDNENSVARLDVLRIVLEPWISTLFDIPLLVMTQYGVKELTSLQLDVLHDMVTISGDLFRYYRDKQNTFLSLDAKQELGRGEALL
jgi:hypothetical protein